jgi:hypothetical protein
MSQFQCPLCGKYNSYARFDPNDFDDDIFGVDFEGLGRGKGFRVSARCSLLDDDHLRGLIVQRSRRILWFTEGVEPPPLGAMAELQKINKDWAAWGAEAQKTMAHKDVEIDRLRADKSGLIGTVNSLREELDQSGPSVYAAQVEEFERENSWWQAAYNKLKSASDAKDKQIQELSTVNQRLSNKVDMYEEASVDDEDSAAAAEMEEFLERINDSEGTNYGNLSDAVDYLLEMN